MEPICPGINNPNFPLKVWNCHNGKKQHFVWAVKCEQWVPSLCWCRWMRPSHPFLGSNVCINVEFLHMLYQAKGCSPSPAAHRFKSTCTLHFIIQIARSMPWVRNCLGILWWFANLSQGLCCSTSHWLLTLFSIQIAWGHVMQGSISTAMCF